MPPYVMYTRDQCPYCDAAKKLFEDSAIAHEIIECKNVADMRIRVGHFAPGTLKSFPFIVAPGGRIVGGFTQLRDELDEPVLHDSLARFSLFPLQHPDIYSLYQKALASFWTADEISLRDDAKDFNGLSMDEQRYLKNVLAFFANSDGVVNENLMKNFSHEIKIPESRLFLASQAFNEAEHSRTYSALVESLVQDPTERDRLHNAILEVPAVKKKIKWSLDFMDPVHRGFAERLVAFACVEGILFSGSFCAIFWLKKMHPGKLAGLSLSNQFIARDEAMHCEHACMVYGKLRHKLAQTAVEFIVGEAVENEKLFVSESLPVDLIGMNARMMCEYIEFVADRLLLDLGHSKMYGTRNPFGWMESISLEGKTNFFENRVSEYARTTLPENPSDVFCMDDVEF